MEAISDQEPQRTNGADQIRAVPAWLAIAVVVLAVGGAAWFVYSQFFAGPRLGQEVDIGNVVRAPSARQVFRQAPAAQPPRDGITAIGPNYWRIKNGEFYMNLALQENALAPLRVYYERGDLIAPDQAQLMAARRQIMANQQLANELKVTPEQLQKLSEVPLSATGQGLRLDPADKERLKTEWQAWLKASDPDAKKATETKLLASLKELGARSIGPTRQEFSDRAAQVKAILTDQQIQMYKQRKN